MSKFTDSIRYNLVTSFVCSQCGEKLALTYKPAKSTEYHPEKEDGITGAAKVEQRIGIHPCRQCYGAAIEPLEALRKALGAISPAKSEAA